MEACNGQLKPDTFLGSIPIKIPLKFQRGLSVTVSRCKKPGNQ
jgi:hypothetical protein